MEVHGVTPADYDPRIPSLTMTAYQMMLEQGRLAFMQTRKGEVWRDGKGFLPLGKGDDWYAEDLRRRTTGY